jgi:hypothetical protein
MTSAGGAQGEILLSRLAPAPEEMARLRADVASYQLVLVGGFSGTPGMNPVVRRQVRMVTEGSVIGAGTADARASRSVGGCDAGDNALARASHLSLWIWVHCSRAPG